MTLLGASGSSAAIEIVTSPSTASVARSVDLISDADRRAPAATLLCSWLILVAECDDSLR
jgi:hypothetical protein